MIQLLAECTGSQGMVGGQAIDLASVDRQLSKQEVEHMHRLKTGALIKASVLLAVIASGTDDPDTHNHFARFAECEQYLRKHLSVSNHFDPTRI